jgi:tellurium resistance protein TerD
MPIALNKGTTISLKKAAEQENISKLEKVVVGLGWDASADSNQQFDLDAEAFLLNDRGAVRTEKDLIYYSNLKGPGIEHTGDNLTGDGDGDDEQIKVNLNTIQQDIKEIAFTVSIYDAENRKQNLGMVQNSFIRIFDEITGKELVRYDLKESFSSETGVIVGKLTRKDGSWEFEAIGTGFRGGLIEICKKYGISAE